MPRRSLPGLLAAGLLFASCASAPETAQDVVDRAILAHGGDIIDASRITFEFRGDRFVLDRHDGLFSYERHRTDTTGTAIREVINNDGTFLYHDDRSMPVDSLTNRRIGNNVNTVAYFTLLPIPLNDPAVIKEDLGRVEIKGEPYRKIGVTFTPDGGGRDYQDRFLFWIHADRYTMDYFAYWYFTDDTGSRFRSVDGVHEVAGVRLQDYLNLAYDGLDFDSINRYDALYNADSLRLVSEVRISNVQVEPY
ncbi:MAG: DUF6503 family protein [Rhodothermales bacterium]